MIPLYLADCPHTERTRRGECIPCTAAVELAESLVLAFEVLRRRYACGLPVECGGTCSRLEGHGGECTCSGGETEECPA